MPRPAPLPHVLFVDDSEIMREVWPLLLEPMGFEITAAADGNDALRLARSRPPDVIVTDMMMPGMTGIDLFNILHTDAMLQSVPVIFMTSGTFPANRPCEDLWLGKNVSPEQLANRIRSLLP